MKYISNFKQDEALATPKIGMKNQLTNHHRKKNLLSRRASEDTRDQKVCKSECKYSFNFRGNTTQTGKTRYYYKIDINGDAAII